MTAPPSDPTAVLALIARTVSIPKPLRDRAVEALTASDRTALASEVAQAVLIEDGEELTAEDRAALVASIQPRATGPTPAARGSLDTQLPRIRVSTTDLERLKREATERGLSLSDYARWRLLG